MWTDRHAKLKIAFCRSFFKCNNFNSTTLVIRIMEHYQQKFGLEGYICAWVNVIFSWQLYNFIAIFICFLTLSSPVMQCGVILFICPSYACLLPSDSSSHLSTLRWLFYARLYMLKSPKIWIKVPVLACFIGAVVAAHTKHARTGTFVRMLGDFSIYSHT
jgi:hypothetical protein